MKTAVIYFSKHHQNTKKVLDYLCQNNNLTLIDAAKAQTEDLSKYDLIGFASGIYYSKFHKSVLKFAQNNLPQNKNVFFIYTYGAKKDGYTKTITKAVTEKSANIFGEFGCLGFNTFGPFKLIGGMAKDHPDTYDFENAENFYRSLINQK